MPQAVRIFLPAADEMSGDAVCVVSGLPAGVVQGLARIVLVIAGLRDAGHDRESVREIVEQARAERVFFPFGGGETVEVAAGINSVVRPGSWYRAALVGVLLVSVHAVLSKSGSEKVNNDVDRFLKRFHMVAGHSMQHGVSDINVIRRADCDDWFLVGPAVPIFYCGAQ